MNKIKLIVCSMVCICFFSQIVFADIVSEDYFAKENYDGTVYTEGNAEVKKDIESLLLNASTDEENQSNPKAYYLSPVIQMKSDEKILYFTYSFKVSATQNLTANRFLKLVWGDDSNLTDMTGINIINIAKNTLRVGSKSYSKAVADDLKHRLTGTIDFNSNKLKVYLDNELLAEDISISISNDIDYNSLRFLFNNYYTAPSDMVISHSTMNIYDYRVNTSCDEIVSVSINKDIVDSEELKKGFYVDYGAVINEPEITVFRTDADGSNEIEVYPSVRFLGFSSFVSLLDSEILPAKKYIIKVNNVNYITGNTVAKFERTFSLMPSDYKAPSVEFVYPTDSMNLRTDKIVTLSANVIKGSEDIKEVCYYVGDELLGKADSSGNYEWITPSQAGNYQLKVTVEDLIGGIVSDTISMKTQKNELPQINIDIEDNAVVNIIEKPEINITSFDDIDVEQTEVYIDGDLYCSENNDSVKVIFANLFLGEHDIEIFATDTDDAISQKMLHITLMSSDFNSYLDLDFSNYAQGDRINGITYQYAGAYAKPVNIDDQHGKSLALGTTEDLYAANGNKCDVWFNIDCKESDNIKKAYVDFEVFMEKGSTASLMTGGNNESGVKTREWLQGISETKLTLKGSKGENITVDWEKNTWHKMRYAIDLEAHTYSFYLENPQTGELEMIAENLSISSEISKLIEVRFIVGGITTNFGSFIIDNVKFQSIEKSPELVSVSDEFGSNGVSYNTGYAILTMSKKMTNISKDNFILYNENGEVNISDALTDKDDSSILYLYPEDGFMSASNYSLLIKKGTIMGNSEIKSDLVVKFCVSCKMLDVLSGAFEVEDKIIFGAVVADMTSSGETVTVVMTILKDNKPYKVCSKTATVDGNPIYVECDLPKKGDYEAYATVIKNWQSRVPVSNKQFKLNFVK